MKRVELLSFLIGIAIGGTFLVYLVSKSSECKDRGGVYVQTIGWFKCVKALDDIEEKP